MAERSGMAGGVAFVPAVPGLAPWGFYGGEGGVARVIEPASQASAGKDCHLVRLGLCDIQAPSASWGTATWHTNWTRAKLTGAAIERCG